MRGHCSARGQIGTVTVREALAAPAWVLHSIVGWVITYLGFGKKNDMCMPLMFRSEAERLANLRYLLEATDIFRQWKHSGLAGLIDQTFLACIQTMSAIPELARYLHEKFDFCYIFTRKFTFDPIEARFGWYRQVNGGNFFMSLKQVLKAEKNSKT